MKKANATSLLAVLVAVLVSSLITACGGGGGDSSGGGTVVTPPPAAPTGTVSSYFPTQGKTGVLKTINPVAVLNVTNATRGEASAVVWKCGSTTINTTATAAMNNNQDGTTSLIVTLAPKTATDSANIHGSDYCTVNGNMKIIGDGGSIDVPVSMSFYIAPDPVTPPAKTCEAPQVLDIVTNTCIYPMSVKLTTFKPLSASSIFIGDAAWNTAIGDNTITKVDSTVVMTGFSTRPINWNIFTRNNGAGYCFTPTYKDDGSAIGNWKTPDSVCKTDAFDWVISVPADSFAGAGLTRHSPVTNQCYRAVWDEKLQTLNDLLVGC